MFLHLFARMYPRRYRGARWFTWLSGVPLIWLIFMPVSTGYWMVWDKLAQYSVTTLVNGSTGCPSQHSDVGAISFLGRID